MTSSSLSSTKKSNVSCTYRVLSDLFVLMSLLYIFSFPSANLEFGAVAGVRNISNPVSLARLVMDRTDHVMLISDGANALAAEMGVPTVDPDELVSPVAKKRWEEWSKYMGVVNHSFNVKQPVTADIPDHETVGAVVRDADGNIAAATSTGGITRKKLGRVGDSPLIGSGACCDNTLGGVSTTGYGESIAKVVLAHRALQLAGSSLDRSGGVSCDLQSAFRQSLQYMADKVGGCAGMIGIGRDGIIAKYHTTTRMSWASVDSNGKKECGITVD